MTLAHDPLGSRRSMDIKPSAPKHAVAARIEKLCRTGTTHPADGRISDTVLVPRPLPAKLDAALRAGRPTPAQLTAARAHGWTWVELARLTRSNPSTLAKRVSRAAAPTPPPVIDPSQWLTSAQVREKTGVSIATLNLWRRAGLFPALWRLTPTKFLYAIADVERILAAPHYRAHGIHRAAVLAMITEPTHPGDPSTRPLGPR